jgi:predicted phage tail protein
MPRTAENLTDEDSKKMMRSIVLHGALADEFGGPYPLDIASPAEAIRALCIMVEGFRERLREGAYAIVRGRIDRDGHAVDLDGLQMGMGREAELHIVPVVAGGAWWVEAIIGATLIAASFFLLGPEGAFAAATSTAFAAAAANATVAIGVSLAIHGVAQLLAPAPTTNNASAAVDQRQSFLFGGQSNVSAQGVPVPLVYGKMRVGSVVTSFGIQTEQLGSMTVGWGGASLNAAGGSWG